MKKGIWGLLFIAMLIVSISGVYALSLDMKDSYQQGETGIAKISGDIREPITKSQVNFYRGHVAVASFDYDIAKIGNDYYVWFITPFSANNYSIEIGDVVSYTNGVIKELTLAKNFSVSENISDYYVKPGTITSNKYFELEVVSNADSPKTISVSYPESRNIQINPGENKIGFSLDNLQSTQVLTINVGKYAIPSYLIKGGQTTNETNEDNETAANQSTGINESIMNISISPERIQRVEAYGADIIYPVEITNLGNESISNITIVYNKKALSIDQDSMISINPNSSITLNVSIITNESVNEIIFIKNGNVSVQLPVQIEFSVLNNNGANNSAGTALFDCVIELNGKLCLPEETCTGETAQSKQGSCCLGQCAVPSATGGSKAWIGWLLALAVLGIIAYVFFKYKGVKPAGNPIDKKVGEIERREIKELRDIKK